MRTRIEVTEGIDAPQFENKDEGTKLQKSIGTKKSSSNYENVLRHQDEDEGP